MNSPLSVEIIKRFHKALEILVEEGVYPSMSNYADSHGFDRSIFNKCRRNPETFRPQVDWFLPIIMRDGLDPYWLYSGIGKPFKNKRPSKKALHKI